MKVRWMLTALLCMALLPAAATALPAPATPAAVPQERDHDDHRDMDRDHDNHRDMDRDHEDWRNHDWDHDRRFEGRSVAYHQGYRDGFTDGRSAREAGRRWHYGPGYKHPDRGYRSEFGDKDDYKREYRQAYEEAYREGYGERR